MLSFSKLVKHQILITKADSGDHKNIVHIAYGADNNFSLGTAVSAVSLLKNNPGIQPHFHLFTDSVPADFIEKCQLLAEEHCFSMTAYLVDTDKLSTLPVKARWPSSIYFRIVAIDYLANEVDRILYLDSDIACCGSISSLLNVDMVDAAVAACLDIDFIEEGDRVALMNAPEVKGKYFNSGVLLVNARAWREHGVSEKIARGLCDPQIKDALLYYDQDLINIAVAGRILFLDGKYNTQYSLNDEYKGTASALPEDITFLHYIGATKPWHQWAKNYSSAEHFLQHKACSPWQDAPLVEPHKKILWRHALKHARHQRQLSAAIKYGLGLLACTLKKGRKAPLAQQHADASEPQPLQKSKALR
ncbi:hypothetical protein RJ498_000492 [Pluralibacter gergoviae]